MPTGHIWSAIRADPTWQTRGRLLTHLGATTEPPAKFARMDYDVPPPLPDELEYVERAVLVFDDPALAFESPPPSPVYFLAPSPPEFLDLTPPAASSGAHTLPVPTFVPLPAYVRLPADVLAPNPSIAGNARETLAIRTAIGLPTKPDEQVAPASISPARTANPLAINPVTSEETKAPPSPPLPTIAATPQWFTDITTLPNRGSDPPSVATDIATPLAPTTMLAPPSSAMPLQTGRNAKQPATGNVPLPVPRSAALAQSQTGLLPRTSCRDAPAADDDRDYSAVGNACAATNSQPLKADRERCFNVVTRSSETAQDASAR